MNDFAADEKKKFITPKSIIWFLIAMVMMAGYYFLINIGLMKVQGSTSFIFGVVVVAVEVTKS